MKNLEKTISFEKDIGENNFTRDGITFSINDDAWNVKTKSFDIVFMENEVHFEKIPFFGNNRDVLFAILGLISGLPREGWPIDRFAKDILTSFKILDHEEE